MNKQAYTPDKEIQDYIAVKILVGRGIQETAAERLIENKKRVRKIATLTAEDVRGLLDNYAPDFEDEDFRYTATSGARKFGEKPKRRKN